MSAQVIDPRVVTNVGGRKSPFPYKKGVMEMVKGCDNCLHSEQPATAPPCNDCIRTLDTDKYWVSCQDYDEEEKYKCCTNCKHVNVLPFNEPCVTCIGCEEDYSEWEEREHDGKKAEDY